MFAWIDKYVFACQRTPWAFPPLLIPFLFLRMAELKYSDKEG